MKGMTGDEVRAALKDLCISEAELAFEWDISERTVRRWCADGCRSHIAVCFDAVLRLKRTGLPWRKNEIAIDIGPVGKIVQLTDDEAIKRHKWLMAQGATAP